MKSAELVRCVLKAGWIEIRQSGSHKIFKHPQTGEIIAVPFHSSKEMGTGLAKKLLKKINQK
ncbi:MAG: hypothetical protein RLZZ28_2415 [Bacteroidota bacterium]|jgi:predicted RNA binding protein YcfA (HicA-like mRNA interferase family)